MKNTTLSFFVFCLALIQGLSAQTAIFVFPDFIENGDQISIEIQEEIFVQVHNNGSDPIEITNATATGSFTINGNFPLIIEADGDAEFGVQQVPLQLMLD